VSSPAEPQFAPQPEPRPGPLAPEPEPVFGLRVVIFAALGFLLAFGIFAALAKVVALRLPAFRGIPPDDVLLDARLLLPVQLAAYLAVLAGLRRWFGHHLGVGVLRALCWQWPLRWARFLAAGAALGVAVQFAAHWLPSPPELPIDKMLRSPADAWLMSVFGVLVAPFAEEFLFRGLLFPALSRRTGAVAGLLLTSLAFGSLHAAQLGHAWLLVVCIMLVGAVLTLVRWRCHSLAASTLVHMGYNATLFAAIFVQTRGFTDLSGK
jgi:CAAX protease family protein